jgi:hypothetical protein
MSHRNRPPIAPASFRLVSEGTRVVVLKGGTPPFAAGTIKDVRTQTHLKPYVVSCDDGAVVYASGHELAREDDALARPLSASLYDERGDVRR